MLARLKGRSLFSAYIAAQRQINLPTVPKVSNRCPLHAIDQYMTCTSRYVTADRRDLSKDGSVGGLGRHGSAFSLPKQTMSEVSGSGPTRTRSLAIGMRFQISIDCRDRSVFAMHFNRWAAPLNQYAEMYPVPASLLSLSSNSMGIRLVIRRTAGAPVLHYSASHCERRHAARGCNSCRKQRNGIVQNPFSGLEAQLSRMATPGPDRPLVLVMSSTRSSVRSRRSLHFEAVEP